MKSWGLLLLVFSGCSLYEPFPPFNERVAVPDSGSDTTETPDFEVCAESIPCGRCNLGVTSCDGGDACLFEPSLSDDSQCNKIVFVSVDAPDQPNGSLQSPFSTIEVAVDSVERGAVVILGPGRFTISSDFAVKPGVSILGGFDLNAKRNKLIRPILEGPDSAASAYGVRAFSVNEPTLISGISIESGNAQRNSFGLFVQRSKQLVLEDVDILSGSAGDGAPGQNGADGTPGNDGSTGGIPESFNINGEQVFAGGPGGEPGDGCDVVNAGGMGGNGGSWREPNNYTQALAGSSVIGGGGGGAAGSSGFQQEGNGGNGLTAPSVSDGQRGNRGNPDILDVSIEGPILLGVGEDGVNGTSGRGGGGGGGARATNLCGGPPGGGGGGGGCGGQLGTGGGPGFASVGCFFGESEVRTINVTCRSGAGGNGGDGGVGGGGGAGGEGAPGGDTCLTTGAVLVTADYVGGDGGDGAAGGRGGDGGAGAGGPSIALICFNSSLKTESIETITGLPGMSGDEQQTGDRQQSIGCD